MSKIQKLFMIVGGSALLLVCMLFGAFFAGPLIASAHTAVTPATATTTAKKTPKNSPYCELYNQTLAKSLNVSTTTLKQDRINAYDAILNQMVKDGKLTQAQANAREQKQAANQACTSFNAHTTELKAVRNYLRTNYSSMENAIAKGLNTTSSNLTTELKNGKTLNQIAKAQNVSKATLASLLKTTVTNQVNTGVSSKALTQDQATAFQQYVTNHPHFFDRLAVRHWKAAKKA